MESFTPNSKLKRTRLEDEDAPQRPRRCRRIDDDTISDLLICIPEELKNDHRSSKSGHHVRDSRSPNGNTQNRSGRGADRQLDSRQRPKAKPRPLVPAASTPNASVFENEQRRGGWREPSSFTFSAQIIASSMPPPPLPRLLQNDSFASYPAGRQLSNHQPGHMLPVDPRQGQLHWRHDPSHRNISTISGGSRPRQTHGVTAFNPAPANQSVNLAYQIPTGATYQQDTVYLGAKIGPSDQSQYPGNSTYFPRSEALYSRLVDVKQSLQSSSMNRDSQMSAMGQSNEMLAGSIPSQAQQPPMQFGIAPVSNMGTGQLQNRASWPVPHEGYHQDNCNSFEQSQSLPNGIHMGVQAPTQSYAPAIGHSYSQPQMQATSMTYPSQPDIANQYPAHNDLQLPEESVVLFEDLEQQKPKEHISPELFYWDPTNFSNPYDLTPKEGIEEMFKGEGSGEMGNWGLGDEYQRTGGEQNYLP